MLHLAHPIPADDALLMSDDERTAFLAMLPRPDLDLWNIRPGESLIGVRFSDDVRRAARRVRDARLRDAPTAADIEDAAADPLLSLVEVAVPPDDSYDALDLDPDLYGYGVPATEAETMDAPFDWDAMTEAA